MILKGEKTILKPLGVEHMPDCWKWINDKSVTRFLAGPYPKTYAGELKWLKKMKKGKSDKVFAILDKKNGKYLGNIGVHDISRHYKKANVGIVIGVKSYWSKGYGTDAMKIFLKYCFEKLGLNKISLTVLPDNPRAIKSYKKCGFIKEGYLRDDICVDGRFKDAILMACVR